MKIPEMTNQQPTETPSFPNAIACEHGRLRRSCNECFLQSELTAARELLNARPTCRCGLSTDEECELFGKLKEAQAEIARLKEAGDKMESAIKAKWGGSHLSVCQCKDCQALAAWEALNK